MDWALFFTIVFVLIAVFFDFTNGFHDAANAIGPAVGNKALSPGVALAVSATFNLIGAFIGWWAGSGVAKTVQSVTDPGEGYSGLALVTAAVIGAICWNLITWKFGIPSSSTHALIGAVAGAAIVAGTGVMWGTIWEKVIIPMVSSPIAGLILAYLLMRLFVYIFRNRNPQRTGKGFRHAEKVSAAALSMGHGMQDAQKTMGVIFLVLVSMGYLSDGDEMPIWVVILAAGAISAGTAAGGKKIIKTLGTKIGEPNPARGFSAESVSSGLLYATALGWEAPVSTTQVMTGSVVGANLERGKNRVRWQVAVNIGYAWVLTLPAAALVAAIIMLIFKLVFGL
ncbi:MAG: inorganic phosphate transporter [Actinobacteria bacterium]|nr:inorganic phosphate transporter [Actinomycetota bacterium]